MCSVGRMVSVHYRLSRGGAMNLGLPKKLPQIFITLSHL